MWWDTQTGAQPPCVMFLAYTSLWKRRTMAPVIVNCYGLLHHPVLAGRTTNKTGTNNTPRYVYGLQSTHIRYSFDAASGIWDKWMADQVLVRRTQCMVACVRPSVRSPVCSYYKGRGGMGEGWWFNFWIFAGNMCKFSDDEDDDIVDEIQFSEFVHRMPLLEHECAFAGRIIDFCPEFYWVINKFANSHVCCVRIVPSRWLFHWMPRNRLYYTQRDVEQRCECCCCSRHIECVVCVLIHWIPWQGRQCQGVVVSRVELKSNLVRCVFDRKFIGSPIINQLCCVSFRAPITMCKRERKQRRSMCQEHMWN